MVPAVMLVIAPVFIDQYLWVKLKMLDKLEMKFEEKEKSFDPKKGL